MAELTHDATDDGFHEIQLSGKQLVFLFMATTVASVVIFLCGVLVGREANSGRTTDTRADAALTTPTPAPSTRAPSQVALVDQPNVAASPVAEPPSPPAGDELTYRKRLEGTSVAPEQLKPPAAARVDPKPDAARPEPSSLQSVAAAAKSATSEAPARGGRSGRWVVQLVALRDRSAASAIVQRLSAKGYPAYLVNPSASTPNQVFKVQIGRYDDKNEAERVSRRLEKEEKFNPWISR